MVIGVPHLAYEQALYWFFGSPVVVMLVVGSLTAIASLVSVLLVLRKWGGYR